MGSQRVSICSGGWSGVRSLTGAGGCGAQGVEQRAGPATSLTDLPWNSEGVATLLPSRARRLPCRMPPHSAARRPELFNNRDVASRVRTICVPSADNAFTTAVRTALAGGGTPSPRDVERRLRAWAPQAVIRLRELSGESDVTWYVYRDGAYAAERDARWHEAPDVPWARYDAATGLVLDANDGFVDLLGYEDGGLIGRPYRDFVFSDATELAVRVYAEIVRTGHAHSVVRLRRANGSSVTVEFVARAGDGSVEGWYRPITMADAAGSTSTR